MEPYLFITQVLQSTTRKNPTKMNLIIQAAMKKMEQLKFDKTEKKKREGMACIMDQEYVQIM